MKYQIKDLPQFILNKNGEWELYGYIKVNVPMPETKEEEEWLEE